MSNEDIVVGLDIGTTKVCTVVGHGDADGTITIVGVGVVPSRGMKKGVVIDVEDTLSAIIDSVERARHMAGVDVKSAAVGVTGDHIQSSNRRGAITVAGHDGVITQDDVKRVLQAAALDVPRERELIHSLPRDFVVDGHRGVRRPVGMCGQRLEVETHVVTGTASFLQNVVQCVERAGLRVESLVLEPIATSEAVATADERELGVALIDIGGGTSDIAVFMDGSIVFSSVISVGGNHVTRDIAIGLRTPFEIAERLKIERGVASPHLIAHGEALEVLTAGSNERLRLPRVMLGEIIEARMIELLEMARASIEGHGTRRRLPAGLVLTGGGALLPGAVDLAQQVFDLPVRLGKPIGFSGWSDQVDNPQSSTAVGLLRFSMRQRTAAPGSIPPVPGSPASTPPQPVTAAPQRRVWGVPEPSANGKLKKEPVAAATAAPVHSHSVPEEVHVQTGAPSGGSAPQEQVLEVPQTEPTPRFDEPAEPESWTPFDRLRQNNPLNRFAGSREAHDRNSDRPDNAPFWQRMLARLRQLIGFETS